MSLVVQGLLATSIYLLNRQFSSYFFKEYISSPILKSTTSAIGYLGVEELERINENSISFGSSYEVIESAGDWF